MENNTIDFSKLNDDYKQYKKDFDFFITKGKSQQLENKFSELIGKQSAYINTINDYKEMLTNPFIDSKQKQELKKQIAECEKNLEKCTNSIKKFKENDLFKRKQSFDEQKKALADHMKELDKNPKFKSEVYTEVIESSIAQHRMLRDDKDKIEQDKSKIEKLSEAAKADKKLEQILNDISLQKKYISIATMIKDMDKAAGKDISNNESRIQEAVNKLSKLGTNLQNYLKPEIGMTKDDLIFKRIIDPKTTETIDSIKNSINENLTTTKEKMMKLLEIKDRATAERNALKIEQKSSEPISNASNQKNGIFSKIKNAVSSFMHFIRGKKFELPAPSQQAEPKTNKITDTNNFMDAYKTEIGKEAIEKARKSFEQKVEAARNSNTNNRSDNER